MIRAFAVATFVGVLMVMGCGNSHLRPNVHVELNDGQLLVGTVTTKTFTLKTEFGELLISTEEAGELGPLEGGDMQQSDHLVKLWLKNGSEFVGNWEKPALEMTIGIGDDDVDIDVPIEKIRRLRFLGHPEYTAEPMYRVLTQAGDDFFVLAAESRIHFNSDMATFSPYLNEIQ